MSPISSRRTVPPSADSMSPGFAWFAPENAPRSYPNNSLSRSASGRAAQLMRTNGFARRGDPAWMPWP
jgi:hypothetical protein